MAEYQCYVTYDQDRGLWVATSREFSFMEATGDTEEEARFELYLAMEEVVYGND